MAAVEASFRAATEGGTRGGGRGINDRSAGSQVSPDGRTGVGEWRGAFHVNPRVGRGGSVLDEELEAAPVRGGGAAGGDDRAAVLLESSLDELAGTRGGAGWDITGVEGTELC